MKKLSFLVMALAIGVFLARCGGGGSSTIDPTKAAADFNNPPGTITSSNAQAVVSAAAQSSVGSTSGNALGGLLRLNSDSSAPMRVLAYVLQKKNIRFVTNTTTIQNCVTASSDGTSGTIDFTCLSNAGFFSNGCTAGGTVSFSITENQTKFTIDYSNFSYSCSGDTISSCNGRIAANDLLDETKTIICANISCTVNSVAESFNGCIKPSIGAILVNDDQGNAVVCLTLTPDSTCANVTSTWTDKSGNKTVTCKISSKTSACPPDATGIEGLSDCTVQ